MQTEGHCYHLRGLLSYLAGLNVPFEAEQSLHPPLKVLPVFLSLFRLLSPHSVQGCLQKGPPFLLRLPASLDCHSCLLLLGLEGTQLQPKREEMMENQYVTHWVCTVVY